MTKQIIARLIQSLITLWAVVTVVFFLMRVSGDPIDMLYAGDPRPEAVAEAESLRETFGLNRPLPVQYLDYLLDVARLDFGRSIAKRRPVAQMLGEDLPHTLRLTLTAFVLSYVVSLPIGVLVALRPGSRIDYGVLVLSMIGVSVPAFWMGIILILVFAVQLQWLPALGVGDRGLAHLVLPTLTLALPRVAFMIRFIRGTMLDVLNEDYLRTARAKGLNENNVLYKHALRNALIPIVTVGGLQLGFLVGGAVVIERLFGLPGVGDLLVDSIANRDFPTVQACVLMLAASIVIVNLAVDILYTYIDPRLRAS
jgi:ABC-type dipeptide/oligopeptide/nickel transport system permease component